MAVLLAYRPMRRRTALKMLWCVAGFGVATILFGISHSLALSMIALILVGATDMVSVVVRGISDSACDAESKCAGASTRWT